MAHVASLSERPTKGVMTVDVTNSASRDTIPTEGAWRGPSRARRFEVLTSGELCRRRPGGGLGTVAPGPRDLPERPFHEVEVSAARTGITTRRQRRSVQVPAAINKAIDLEQATRKFKGRAGPVPSYPT